MRLISLRDNTEGWERFKKEPYRVRIQEDLRAREKRDARQIVDLNISSSKPPTIPLQPSLTGHDVPPKFPPAVPQYPSPVKPAEPGISKAPDSAKAECI